MSKKPETSVRNASQRQMGTRELTICALLCALDVVLGRLIIPMPNVAVRFSIEATPIILAGYFFGPVAGMMVGFAGDTVGCLFSGYGWDPILSVSPMLIGMFAGLLRSLAYDVKKPWDIWKVILTILPGKALGSVYWTSQCLMWLGYSKKGMGALLAARSVEACIEGLLEAIVITLLLLTGVFRQAKLFPPVKREKTKAQKFRLAGAVLLLVQVAVFIVGSLTIGLGFMNEQLSVQPRIQILMMYLEPTRWAILMMILSYVVTDRKNEE